MVKNKKQKGTTWERTAVRLLTEMIPESRWKRIAGSGALGTLLEEPLLTGDIVGNIIGIPKTIRAEAKVGYGGATQMAVKKEWLEKIRYESAQTYSIPMLLGKFSGARGDSKHFVVMDFPAFAEITKLIYDYAKSEIDLLDKLENDIGK